MISRAVIKLHLRKLSSGPVLVPKPPIYDPVSHVIKSPYTVELSNLNLPDFIWRNLQSLENKPAITCGISGRSFSYGQAFGASQNFGANLKESLRLKSGEVIAVVLPNLPEFPVAFYGAAAAGLVVSFANPLYTDEELSRQFTNAKVRAVVTIPLLLDKVKSALDKVPGGGGPVILINGEKLGKDEIDFKEWIEKRPRGTEDILKAARPDPEQLVALPYSSGTTGAPKGVMLSHRNLVSNLCQMWHPAFSDLEGQGSQHRILAIIPFFHIYGLNAVLNGAISRGYHVITLPKFEPDTLVAALKEYQPTVMSLVPPLISFLAKSPTVTKEHLRSLQILSNGAATCPLSSIEELGRKMVGEKMQFKEGYGLTEVSCMAAMTLRQFDPSKLGSCGLAAPLAEIKVVDPHTGAALAMGKTGELLYRGPNVMLGYLNNPEATKETITEDGWLRTGDIAFVDPDGYIFLVDRLKELIKVKGFQVSPTELEEEVRKMDGVADVAVIAIPDDKFGEVPKAFVVKKAGAEISEQQITQFMEPRVADFKQLRGGVQFLKEIPRSAAGKILRKDLKNVT